MTLRPRLSVGFALFEAEWIARQRIPLGLNDTFYLTDGSRSFVTIEAQPQERRDERHFLEDGRLTSPMGTWVCSTSTAGPASRRLPTNYVFLLTVN